MPIDNVSRGTLIKGIHFQFNCFTWNN